MSGSARPPNKAMVADRRCAPAGHRQDVRGPGTPVLVPAAAVLVSTLVGGTQQPGSVTE